VETGDVSEDRIDDAVRRILTVKFALALFERPHGDAALLDLVGSDEHRAVAREAVARSQVLLRNEGGLLPFAPDLPVLYVAGSAADDIGIQSGGWTISWQGGSGETTPGTSILEGISATVSPTTTVVYNRSGEFELLDGPVVCLGVFGEFPYAEGQGDNPEPTLLNSDWGVLERLGEQCDQLAVVLVSGRPLLVSDHIDGWDALVAAWLPGTEGQGVADVLFGIEPFTGTLPYTWPRGAEQLGTDPGAISDPLFAFGFGLG
jgi:beta-glucosidase